MGNDSDRGEDRDRGKGSAVGIGMWERMGTEGKNRGVM